MKCINEVITQQVFNKQVFNKFSLHNRSAYTMVYIHTGNAGGGSGGALYVEAYKVTGHGVVSVHGGHGAGTGGGGAGGRVAIKCKMHYRFGGIYDNYGGRGIGSYVETRAGASGTFLVYIVKSQMY